MTVAALAAGWLAWGSALERTRAEVDPASLAAAERALVAAPIEARSASALGLARFAAGDGRGAAAAFRVAGALGWRDRPAQLYLLAVALQAGDVATAAARIDAVLRQEPHLPGRAALLAPLEATPAGRRALALRLGQKPAWLRTYFASLDGVAAAQLARRALVMTEPALGRAAPGCGEIGEFVGALRASGQVELARGVRGGRCGGGAAGAIADGGFERARVGGETPFGWRFPGAGGLDVRLTPVAGFAGRALRVSSKLATPQVVAAQTIDPGPGRWTVSWRAAGVSTVLARLACRPGEGTLVAGRRIGPDRFAVTATLPGDCPAPAVELGIAPDSGATVIDDVTLSRAR